MILKILLSLILTIPVTTGIPQKFINFPTYNIDSLLSILPGQVEEEQVNSLNYLAVSLSYINFDSSMLFANKAMKLSEELNYMEGIAEAYRNFGLIYQYQGNYPLALKNFFKALSAYEKLGEKARIARIYWDISITHYFAVNYKESIEYGNIALDKYREKTKEGTTVGTVKDTMAILGGAGLIYFLTDSCDKSIDITLKYLEVGRKNNFNKTDLFFFQILAGERFNCAGEKDSALLYLNKALDYSDSNRDIKTLKYRAITSLGNLYLSAGDYDMAIIYYNKAFEFYHKTGFLFWATGLAKSLGYTYFKKNQLDIAEDYYHQAEITFNEMVHMNSWHRHDSLKHIASWGMELYIPLPPEKMKELMWKSGKYMYYMLYQIKNAKGKTDEALKYYIAYSNAEDTVNKISHSHELIQLQTNYETERYEEEIKNLSQENAIHEYRLEHSRYLLFGLVGFVIVILLVAFFIVRLNKLQGQQQNLLLQQKLFRSQMNPHFIFNSLTSIQNFILDEEAHKASKYLSRFSKLVRNILDSSIEEYVPLEEEISTIENYLELQKIRFQNKFDYTIEVDEAINPESMNIPPMLAQPFIENSIEHGIKHKKIKGNIHIRFSLKNNMIVFEVEDDGVGRDKAREILYEQNKEHKSLATAITLERIRVLNKKLKKKIMLHILDLKNSENEPLGTKVQIKIPF